MKISVKSLMVERVVAGRFVFFVSSCQPSLHLFTVYKLRPPYRRKFSMRGADDKG